MTRLDVFDPWVRVSTVVLHFLCLLWRPLSPKGSVCRQQAVDLLRPLVVGSMKAIGYDLLT